MQKQFILLGFFILSGCGGGFEVAHQGEVTDSSSLIADMTLEEQRKLGKELYQKSCASCHGGFDSTVKDKRSAQQIKVAIQGSSDGEYPPIAQMQMIPQLKALSDVELSAIAIALGGKPFVTEDGGGLAMCEVQDEPGRVTAHRLNRAEYTNSINDILGIDSEIGELLPPDAIAHGFTNNADALTVTSYSIEKYLEASRAALDQAFNTNATQALGCELSRLNRSCAETALMRFAQSAFRRPVRTEERAKILNLLTKGVDEGLDLAESTKIAAQWIFSAPQFLFRIIDHSSPNDPSSIKELGGYELASRLSYFLWSSVPDQELMSLASENELTREPVLDTQVDRMLADPRSQALVDNFAMQWIEAHRFEMAAPNTTLYNFSEPLRQDMLTESKLFFDEIFKNDLSLLRVLDADFTFINSRLAAHYNMTGPASTTNFQKVSLAGTGRRGVLTQGSVLTSNSYEGRTSVVLRGKFVLDNVLCEPPPPPPPEAEGIIVDPTKELNIREQMQAHRANPMCASCHASMDPIGFSLESFNAVGEYRNLYKDGQRIDTSGALPDGRKFASADQLTQILKADPSYKVCVSKKLMTYALGRELNSADECTVNRLAVKNVGESYGLSDLIKGIVNSDPFKKQQGDSGEVQ